MPVGDAFDEGQDFGGVHRAGELRLARARRGRFAIFGAHGGHAFEVGAPNERGERPGGRRAAAGRYGPGNHEVELFKTPPQLGVGRRLPLAKRRAGEFAGGPDRFGGGDVFAG